METLPDLNLNTFLSQTFTHLNILLDVLQNQSVETEKQQLKLLNITLMTAQRKDGHSSLYYRGSNEGPAALHRQDCSHWCLPGVPDTWNELLYAYFLKTEMANLQNATADCREATLL